MSQAAYVAPTHAQAPLPTHLKHQAVFALPYNALDAMARGGPTDAQFLSLGWSQWDAHEVSGKIMRNPDDRWSRQSEEMPLNRIVDLATLLALAMRTPGRQALDAPAGAFGAAEGTRIPRHDNQSGREAFNAALRDDADLKRRLRVLADLLGDMKGDGTI